MIPQMASSTKPVQHCWSKNQGIYYTITTWARINVYCNFGKLCSLGSHDSIYTYFFLMSKIGTKQGTSST